MLFLFPSLPQQLIQKLLGRIKQAYSILSELTCTFNKKINERGIKRIMRSVSQSNQRCKALSYSAVW